MSKLPTAAKLIVSRKTPFPPNNKNEKNWQSDVENDIMEINRIEGKVYLMSAEEERDSQAKELLKQARFNIF